MGGTLDIRTFYQPLSWLKPCTINLALDMRTTVRLLPYEADQIKVSSRGFDSAEMPLHSVPFSHPLGLIFAVAYSHRTGGLHIEIDVIAVEIDTRIDPYVADDDDIGI